MNDKEKFLCGRSKGLRIYAKVGTHPGMVVECFDKRSYKPLTKPPDVDDYLLVRFSNGETTTVHVLEIRNEINCYFCERF